jgi:hypothetical protein
VSFQTAVKDPPVVVPARVNEADIVYEKTSTPDLLSSNLFEGGILNLQGLDPADINVRDPSQTLVLASNITGPGIGHSEVHDWYRNFLVDSGDLATNTTPSVLVPPSNLGTSVILSGKQVSTLTAASMLSIFD